MKQLLTRGAFISVVQISSNVFLFFFYLCVCDTHSWDSNLRCCSSKLTVIARFKSTGCLLPTKSTAEATRLYTFPGGRGRNAVSSVIPDNNGINACFWSAPE